LIALVAFACGAVIGFKVPVACRINLVTPLDPIMARALREVQQMDWSYKSRWDLRGYFSPHPTLGS
jgi:hypothetical protein